MKFQTPFILLTSILSYVSANAADTTALDARQHPRDFVSGFPDNAVREVQVEEESYLSKRGKPEVPKGKDDTKLHVWIRTDSRPITYDDRSGAHHDGLNQLMKDTGGRHKDVVIGNSKGYYEYGLQFDSENGEWQKKPNGDGAEISQYAGEYVEVKGGHETYEYMGQVGDGRKTLKSIEPIGENEIAGKHYDHVSYNCATFAQNLVKLLNVRK